MVISAAARAATKIVAKVKTKKYFAVQKSKRIKKAVIKRVGGGASPTGERVPSAFGSSGTRGVRYVEDAQSIREVGPSRGTGPNKSTYIETARGYGKAGIIRKYDQHKTGNEVWKKNYKFERSETEKILMSLSGLDRKITPDEIRYAERFYRRYPLTKISDSQTIFSVVRHDKHAKRLNITKESTDKAKYSYDKRVKHISSGRLGSGFSVSDSDYKITQFADGRGLFPTKRRPSSGKSSYEQLKKDDLAAIYEAHRSGIEPERVFWSKDKNAYYYHSKGQLVPDPEFGLASWVPINKKPTGKLRHFKEVKFKKPSKSRDMLIGSKKIGTNWDVALEGEPFSEIRMIGDMVGTPFLRKKTSVSVGKQVRYVDRSGGIDKFDEEEPVRFFLSIGEDADISTYGIRLPIVKKGLSHIFDGTDEFEYPGYGIQVITGRTPSNVVRGGRVTRRVVSIGKYRDSGYSPNRIVQLTTTKTPKINRDYTNVSWRPGKRKTTRAKTKVKVQYTSNRKRKIGGSWVDTSKRQLSVYEDEPRIITDEAYGFGFTLPHPTKLEKYAITGGVVGGTAYGVGQIKKKKKKRGKR